MAMSASIDRLSGLPEEVIGHILSFLPSTKSLVQTSILAKQWRFLWTRVPSLRFFTVNEDSKSTDDEFSSWIDQTTTISARNLVIRLNYQLTLPRSLFTINTLVDLCIVDSGDIRAEGFAYNFPALKKLRLVNVGFDSDDSLAHLISGCPVLEELTIDGMMLNYSCDPSVLRVNRIMGARKLLNMLNDKPALRYLRLRTACEIPWIWSCSHHRLHSLIEADIDLMSEVDREFLHNLHDVKRLTLSIRGKEIPSRINLSLIQPVFFRNLTELNLRGDWYFITVFLSCAVNLRVLTIHSMVGHNTRCWIEPQNYISLWTNYTSEWLARTSKLRSTLMDHLETVNLFDFEWSTKHEFEMVKYILGKAKVLKTMELIYTAPQSLESDWTRKVVEAHNTLASFEMQSSTCSIRLSLC